MRISFLVGSADHPIVPVLQQWKERKGLDCHLMFDVADLDGGDILFLISYNRLVSKRYRSLFNNTLVLHASDVPRGRGWSPHVWSILEGAESITVSLLEAEDKIDSGAIWKKVVCRVPREAIFNEINSILFEAELELIDYAIENYHLIVPTPQPTKIEPTYYRRRTAEDSELDPSLSIGDQFDLLRVADPIRYPAYFKYRGETYFLTLRRDEIEEG